MEHNFNFLEIYFNVNYILSKVGNLFSHFDTLTIFYIINTLIVFTIIFLEFQTASSSWAWILVLLLIPYIGLILYLALGKPIYKKKIFPFTREEKIKYQQLMLNKNEAYIIDENNKVVSKHKNLIELNFRTDESFLSYNNYIEIIIDGKEKFKKLFDDIKNAKKYIYIQYYIMKKDNIGKELINLLKLKLQEGVKVYLLYDDIGSRTLNDYTLKNLKKAGAKTKSFFKANFSLVNMRMNYRNHRKVVVIDGEIGYTGGFNVGDEYLGFDKNFGYWRDTHLRIKGEAVSSLNLRFINDWNSQVLNKNKDDLINLTETHKHKHFNLENKIPIQIVTSGPDSKLEQIKYGYIHIINNAKKYIYIQSPYFVPDESVIDALKIAILSGVDVRIMIPEKPDHIFVHWANYSYVGKLLKMGAKVYEYTNGFLHSKTIIADDEIASVGTANFDYRSFKLNFEVNSFIYEKETTKKLKKIFMNDINSSKQLTIDKYNKRNNIVRMKEAIAQLISPIL